jgi:hypothetical protein
MHFEEHLREYQKVVLTHFLKKIDLRLYRTQPTNLLLFLVYEKTTKGIIFMQKNS